MKTCFCGRAVAPNESFTGRVALPPSPWCYRFFDDTRDLIREAMPATRTASGS